jgi:hypothetical protein
MSPGLDAFVSKPVSSKRLYAKLVSQTLAHLAQTSAEPTSSAVSGLSSSGSSTQLLGVSARAAMSFLQTLKPSSTAFSTFLPSQSLVLCSYSVTATSTQLLSVSTSATTMMNSTHTRRLDTTTPPESSTTVPLTQSTTVPPELQSALASTTPPHLLFKVTVSAFAMIPLSYILCARPLVTSS